MHRFETLDIWHSSVSYGVGIYKVSKNFPRDEVYGLTSQIRRAAVSISSNIAEGSGSNSKKDFQRFLDIAVKSALETVSQLKFAIELGYIHKSQIEQLSQSAELLIKRIYAFRNSLNHKP